MNNVLIEYSHCFHDINGIVYIIITIIVNIPIVASKWHYMYIYIYS